MRQTRLLAFAIVFALLISACAQQKIKPEVEVKLANIPTESINLGYRKALAHQYLEQQDFHAALTQWKVLRAIDAKNPEYINRIRVLEALIKRRIKLFLKQGKEQLLNDELKNAEKSLLKALALDPNNHFALKMMRQIEAKRVQKVQIAKTQKLMHKQNAKYEAEQKRLQQLAQRKSVQEEPEDEKINLAEGSQEAVYLDMGRVLYKQGDWGGAIREINKYLSSNKSTADLRQILKHSHMEMSRIFQERGHWDPAIQHLGDALINTNTKWEIVEIEQKISELKLKAAENYYIEGVKVYRDNVGRAILFWQQALNHNPSHLKAKNRLKKAEVIQQNLRAISR